MNKIISAIMYILIFVANLSANEFRAYGIGGDTESSKALINIKGEEYTLLPFSYLNLKIEDMNKDGEYTVFIGKINGKEIAPIKVSSNYKNEYLTIKVFKGSDKFDESTFITQSSDIYTDDSYKFFDLTIE